MKRNTSQWTSCERFHWKHDTLKLQYKIALGSNKRVIMVHFHVTWLQLIRESQMSRSHSASVFPTWQLMPACVGDINSSQCWKLTNHLFWHPAHIPEKEGISICIMSQQNGIFGKGALLDNGKTMPPWRTPSEIPGAKKCDLVCKGYCTSAWPPNKKLDHHQPYPLSWCLTLQSCKINCIALVTQSL